MEDKGKKEKIKLKGWRNYSLSPRIKKVLLELGYQQPTPIQYKSFKASLIENKNVLGAARTGSGKTLAYAIPVVQGFLERNKTNYAQLKRKISKHFGRREDFSIKEDDEFAIEDLIVDKELDNHNDEPKDSAAFGIETGDDDSDSEEGGSTDNQDDRENYTCPEAIILVPTRELATQVRNELEQVCKYTKITSYCIIGGLSQEKQIRQLNQIKPDIVIATPGRLYEIVQSELVCHLNIHSIASIRTLVIDEADRMMQKGHFEEMLKILDTIKGTMKFRGDKFPFRVFLFSATLTFLHELPDRLKNGQIKSKKSKPSMEVLEHTRKNKLMQMIKILGISLKETKIIDINNEAACGRPSSEQLVEYHLFCERDEKDLFLYHFISLYRNFRILIFCNSKDCLRRLANVLKWLEINCLKLHSDMDQKKRLSSIENFRAKEGSVMIATDVAARGLDIKELEAVVHYQVPKTCESYIHRSGRTARFNNKGVALTLVEPSEVHSYKRLCNTINGGKQLKEFEVDPMVKKSLKDRVMLAQLCDKLDHQIRSSKTERSWFLKAAKECDIELDDDDMRHINGRGKQLKKDTQEDVQKRRQLAALSKKLKTMLT